MFGDYVPLPKQFGHDPYSLAPKGKQIQTYSFMKSLLKTQTKLTFLLKLQVALRKADQVKKEIKDASLNHCKCVYHIWSTPGIAILSIFTRV